MEDLDEIAFCVRQAYEPAELQRIDRQRAASIYSDPLDVELLSAVGVPQVEELEISFNLISEAPRLRDYVAGRFGYSSDWPDDVRCINSKYDFVYGIDKSRGDSVICIDLTGKYHSALFINSKIRYFVAFLAECRLHFHRRRLGSHSRDASLQQALNWMDRIDPGAIRQEWWQGVFEDMKLYD